MIKIENVETSNWRAAVRGMRNPLESWGKSDSYFQDMYCGCFTRLDEEDIPGVPDHYQDVYLGPNDLDLMKRLVNAGTDHSKFMRMITVSFDIVAPLYWWKEFDTYRIGVVRNSCSTMHKIEARPLVINDFSKDGLEPVDIEVLMTVILHINKLIEEYKEATGEHKLAIHRRIVKLLPDSYLQRATITTNYQVLRNIRNSDRKTHKLEEWKIDFMKFIDSLPYAEELLIKEENGPLYKFLEKATVLKPLDKEYRNALQGIKSYAEKKDPCAGLTCYSPNGDGSYTLCPELTTETDPRGLYRYYNCQKKEKGIAIPERDIVEDVLIIEPKAFDWEEF